MATRADLFALVVVQHPQTKKFLLVRETRERGWWIPGGHVEAGEEYVAFSLSLDVLICGSFFQAAHRETLEEGGIDIRLLGLLTLEMTPGKYIRQRYDFVV